MLLRNITLGWHFKSGSGEASLRRERLREDMKELMERAI